MYLMHKNIPVLQFNIENGLYRVLQPNLLPHRLKNALFENDTSIAGIMHNYDVMVEYLASRVLDFHRENTKKLLNTFHFSQDDSPTNKARIAVACQILSMVDSYWVRNEDEAVTWESLNPRQAPINNEISNIALLGNCSMMQETPHTPEFTTQGTFAKAWIREGNDNYLYKRSSKTGNESEIEISVSHILDHFNVPHVQYLPASYNGIFMCKCLNLANDELDLLTSEDFYTYCNRNNKDFLTEALSIDSENIYKMCIVDYLISNSDRHNQNWGFYVNNSTGNIVICHPLYDHNNAFNTESMKSIDGDNSMIFSELSQKEAALHSIKKCNFLCLEPLGKEDFLSYEMYESFMEKANALGLYKKLQPTLLQKLHFVKCEPYAPNYNYNIT